MLQRAVMHRERTPTAIGKLACYALGRKVPAAALLGSARDEVRDALTDQSLGIGLAHDDRTDPVAVNPVERRRVPPGDGESQF